MIRYARLPDALTADLRQILRRIDPDLPLTKVRTQRQQIDANLHQERLFATLTSSFGILALLLAWVGVYGIMVYIITQRTQEIDIRLALGAQPRQIRTLVLREGLHPRHFRRRRRPQPHRRSRPPSPRYAYGLQPRDPASLIGTAGLLLTIALLAGWIPAFVRHA